jgi:hypothetical protein
VFTPGFTSRSQTALAETIFERLKEACQHLESNGLAVISEERLTAWTVSLSLLFGITPASVPLPEAETLATVWSDAHAATVRGLKLEPLRLGEAHSLICVCCNDNGGGGEGVR